MKSVAAGRVRCLASVRSRWESRARPGLVTSRCIFVRAADDAVTFDLVASTKTRKGCGSSCEPARPISGSPKRELSDMQRDLVSRLSQKSASPRSARGVEDQPDLRIFGASQLLSDQIASVPDPRGSGLRRTERSRSAPSISASRMSSMAAQRKPADSRRIR